MIQFRYLFGIPCILLLLLCAITYHAGLETFDPPIVKNEIYGVVNNVDNCKVGKRTYRCDVQTNLKFYKDFPVHQFPRQFFEEGDLIYFQTVFNGKQAEILMCQNNQCKPFSFCPWWMFSCFGDYRGKEWQK